jgi:hypothetical protein
MRNNNIRSKEEDQVMGNNNKIKGRISRPHEHQDQEEEEDEVL